MERFLITTAFELPGFTIEENLGLVVKGQKTK